MTTETEPTFVITSGRGMRYHRPTCKRLNQGLIRPRDRWSAGQVRASALVKAATCCKPKLPEAVGPKSPVQGAPSSADQHAQVNRASAQRKALRCWEENGEKGKRPETSDYDALVAARNKVTGKTTTPEPATAPADAQPEQVAVLANGRRRVTDPAEQRRLIETLLGAGAKPSSMYRHLRNEGIAASGAWVEPLLNELTDRRAKASA